MPPLWIKTFSFITFHSKGKSNETDYRIKNESLLFHYEHGGDNHSPIYPSSVDARYQATWRSNLDPILFLLLQVVSLGLYFGDQAYLRSSWNVLDGFLVFVSLIDIVVSVASAGGAKILGVLRVLRLLRTLRPLRSESHHVLFCSSFLLVPPGRVLESDPTVMIKGWSLTMHKP